MWLDAAAAECDFYSIHLASFSAYSCSRKRNRAASIWQGFRTSSGTHNGWLCLRCATAPAMTAAAAAAATMHCSHQTHALGFARINIVFANDIYYRFRSGQSFRRKRDFTAQTVDQPVTLQLLRWGLLLSSNPCNVKNDAIGYDCKLCRIKPARKALFSKAMRQNTCYEEFTNIARTSGERWTGGGE